MDESKKRERAAKRRRRRRQFIGVVVMCLSLIGAATLVTLTVYGIRTLTAPKQSETDYRSLIAPLVSMDPTPFESIEDANQDVLLEAAIWAAISYEDTTKYSRNDEGNMLVPAVDVDRYITRMYGKSFTMTHHSFSDAGLEFNYVEDVKSYAVPITSQGGAYFPRIDAETNSGNTKILKVAYMQYSGTAAEMIMDDESQKVGKYMEYVLLRDSGGYYIYSVRTVEE